MLPPRAARAALSATIPCLATALAGCATFAPNVDGMYAAEATAAGAEAPPALVLIGDIGLPRGEDTRRLAASVAASVEGAEHAPVLVLGDVFYVIGLVGACDDYAERAEMSMFRCDSAGRPEDQLESVLGPYRDALPGNPVLAIGGNHDYYGGEVAVTNTCRLVPRAGENWRYWAKGCGLDDENPIATIDLGDLVVFAVDSEPMIRDKHFRRASIEALRKEIARFRSERPGVWRVVATHHPMETHGSHNGATKLTGALKDTYWLRKTALYPLFFWLERIMGQQDPYELRYRAFRRELYRLFREQPVDLFASGHDHSLQYVAIDHPGLPHQIVSGAGANRSPVQRWGQDFLWLNRLARGVGLGSVLPAPRHRLVFGLGGEIEAEDLSGYGFVTLTPDADELVADFFDPARAEPLHTSRLGRAPAAD